MIRPLSTAIAVFCGTRFLFSFASVDLHYTHTHTRARARCPLFLDIP
jgi:hypothetical protein